MRIQKGDIVRSCRGHDEGRVYFVLETEEDFLYLVNGKQRKIETPKKKRRKHVSLEGRWTHPVTDRILRDETVLDSEIRRALAAFRDKFSETKEV